MTSNLKALGLALLAAFAISTAAASAASADLFVAPPDTVVTAENHTENHAWTYGLGTVECEVTNFSGTTGEAAEETSLKITPTFDGCEFGGVKQVVRTNHCYYVFTSHTDENGDAPIHLECEETNEEPEHIEFELVEGGSAGCTVTLGEQTEHAGGVRFTNGGEGNEEDITVDMTAEFEAVRDNPTSGFLCSLLPASGTMLTTGNFTLKGYEYNSGPEKEWTEEDGHQTEGTGTTHWFWQEGSQVGISVNATG